MSHRPNDHQEYFVVNQRPHVLDLTRLGSFEVPELAIRAANQYFSDNLYTILTARCVGKLEGMLRVFLAYFEDDQPVAHVWKKAAADWPIGLVGLPMDTRFEGVASDITTIPGQDKIVLRRSEALALLRRINKASI